MLLAIALLLGIIVLNALLLVFVFEHLGAILALIAGLVIVHFAMTTDLLKVLASTIQSWGY